MKDVLQREKTPYEVLGVERDASTGAINNALKVFIGQRGDMRKGLAAKASLLEPVRRAMVDILYYDRETVASLTPSPVEDPSVLAVPNRATTVASWERSLRVDFPNLGMIHSLAVLWYWWANHEEAFVGRLVETVAGHGIALSDTPSRESILAAARQAEGVHCQPGEGNGCQHSGCPWREDCTSGAPRLEVMWQSTIAYWVMLLNMPQFWDGPARRHAGVAERVKTEFVNSLKLRLDALEEQYRKEKAWGLATVYAEMRLALQTEARTARLMTEVGVSLKRDDAKLCCGALLLQRLNLLNQVQSRVDDAVRGSKPGDWHDLLVRLRDALSPYASVAELIRNDKPDAALAAIDKLPAQDRKTDEIISLRAKAMLAKGQQQASVGDIDEAVDTWSAALEASADTDIQARARKSIVSTVQERAAYLAQHRQEDAIALAERGLRIVDDEGLRVTLGEMLTSRGISRVNKAQRSVTENGITQEDVAALEGGVADLERAVELGSKRAIDQVKVARQILDYVKAPRAPSKVQQWMEKAGEAAKKERWDEAIALLDRVLKELKGEAPTELKKMLAASYSNRAVGAINQVLEGVQKDIEKWNNKVKKELSHGSGSYECARCRRSQFKHRYESWYGLELPSVGKVTLCKNCVGKVRKLLEGRPKPSSKVLSVLSRAHNDLTSARQLDPKNETVPKRLKELEEILSQIRT